MAEIKPFKGLTYNQEIVGGIHLVVTPPYDIISPEDQKSYYRHSQYNIIRLDLGKDFPTDTETENKYTRAAAFLNQWQAEGVLKQSSKEAFYIYEQEYTVKNGQKKRTGFIGLLKLADFSSGTVLPHEKTLSKPKEDRLRLMRATKANLSSIFSLYSDPEHRITKLLDEQKKSLPLIDFWGEEDVRNRLWEITDPAVIDKISALMSDKTFFIADGHHRYETALAYRDEMRAAHPEATGSEPWNYVMMFFVNMDDEGLTVLPVHRVLKNIDFNPLKFLTDARQFFEVRMLHSPEKLFEQLSQADATCHAFGLYFGGDEYYLLVLKDADVIDAMLSKEHSKNWKRLDVTLLHNIVIYYLLGLKGRDLEKEEIIEFTKDEAEAIEKVRRGERRVVFFVNPTKISEVKKIATNNERMPQKSTYFYPKPLTGLVINKLDGSSG